MRCFIASDHKVVLNTDSTLHIYNNNAATPCFTVHEVKSVTVELDENQEIFVYAGVIVGPQEIKINRLNIVRDITK